MNAAERNKATRQANTALARLPQYADDMSAWLTATEQICEGHGFSVDLGGIYCGRDGETRVEAVEADGKVARWLKITWHKMQSGRYEMIAYLS